MVMGASSGTAAGAAPATGATTAAATAAVEDTDVPLAVALLLLLAPVDIAAAEAVAPDVTDRLSGDGANAAKRLEGGTAVAGAAAGAAAGAF